MTKGLRKHVMSRNDLHYFKIIIVSYSYIYLFTYTLTVQSSVNLSFLYDSIPSSIRRVSLQSLFSAEFVSLMPKPQLESLE
jgi:hypothetical protein